MNSNEEELKVILKKALDNGSTPNPLYKYRSFNQRSLQILKKGEIWFSSPLKFNDPFDWQLDERNDYSIEDIEHYFENLSQYIWKKNEKTILLNNLKNTEKTIAEETIKGLIEKTRKSLFHEFGILSLSLIPDSILMWSHYCNNHSGFVLEFSFQHDINLYQFPIICEYVKLYEPISFFTKREPEMKRLIKLKHEDWGYEKEVRIVKKGCANKLIPFNKKCISGIYFGLNTSEDNIRKVKNICRREKMNPTLYKAEREYGKFSIKFKILSYS